MSTRGGGGLELIARHRAHGARGALVELNGDSDLPLLALLVRHYRLENATLTTRGESPAGAGIAGSSALTIAVCGALARFTGASSEPEHLLQVAMNVECQTIRVPTGVQDYRPALYGGVAAIRLGVTGIRRVPLDVDPRELEQRIVLAYTGAPRNSGTNNWDITKRHTDGDRHIFDCFERIRDTAAAMREALVRGDWAEVGRQIAIEWENRKRLAPGVTTPIVDDLIARAQSAGADAAKVCSAAAAASSAMDRRTRGAPSPTRCPKPARTCSITRSKPKASALDNPAIARILREIADLLEIKNENPFKIRAYRNVADIASERTIPTSFRS